MNSDELRTIENLTGVSSQEIKLADDGFFSRGYVIDGGRIVFKFKKSPEVSYITEIKMLNFVNSLNWGINTQKVRWVSPEDEYLGVYGVVRLSLEVLSKPDYRSIGEQLAYALRRLHQVDSEEAEVISVEDEIKAWQERYRKSHSELVQHFSETEVARLDR